MVSVYKTLAFKFFAILPFIITFSVSASLFYTLFLSVCSLSSARYAVNHSISFAWGNLSALSRSSLKTGVVDDADSARPVDASTRKLK